MKWAKENGSNKQSIIYVSMKKYGNLWYTFLSEALSKIRGSYAALKRYDQNPAYLVILIELCKKKKKKKTTFVM